jgi:hypothetical protein
MRLLGVNVARMWTLVEKSGNAISTVMHLKAFKLLIQDLLSSRFELFKLRRLHQGMS